MVPCMLLRKCLIALYSIWIYMSLIRSCRIGMFYKVVYDPFRYMDSVHYGVRGMEVCVRYIFSLTVREISYLQQIEATKYFFLTYISFTANRSDKVLLLLLFLSYKCLYYVLSNYADIG